MPRRSYLYFLAATRGVYASVEQPLASLLFSEPRIRAMIEMTRSDYLFLWMGGRGGLSMKPTALWTTLPLHYGGAIWAEHICKEEVRILRKWAWGRCN